MRQVRAAVGLVARLCTLAALGFVMTGCRSGESESSFEPRSLIEPSAYEVTDLAWKQEPARAWIDGELQQTTRWLGSATFTNRLDRVSPNYDLRYRATFADGTVSSEGLAGLVFPLARHQATTISFIITAAPSPVTSCEIIVYDSVLNYPA